MVHHLFFSRLQGRVLCTRVTSPGKSGLPQELQPLVEQMPSSSLTCRSLGMVHPMDLKWPRGILPCKVWGAGWEIYKGRHAWSALTVGAAGSISHLPGLLFVVPGWAASQYAAGAAWGLSPSNAANPTTTTGDDQGIGGTGLWMEHWHRGPTDRCS